MELTDLPQWLPENSGPIISELVSVLSSRVTKLQPSPIKTESWRSEVKCLLVFPSPSLRNLYNHYEGNEQSIGWFPASMSCILSRDNLANLFYFLFFIFFVTLLFDITKIKEKLLFSIRELNKPACLGSKYIWKEML